MSHPIVAELMGWSASTAVRMIKEVYGHVGLNAKRRAMDQMESMQAALEAAHKASGSENLADGAQKGAQQVEGTSERLQ